MEQFHGTNNQSAVDLASGRISVSLGGGELGGGFYTGDQLYEAHAWAYQKYQKAKAVLKLEIDDDEFLNLNPRCLSRKETHLFRKKIRDSSKTRSFLFNENVIWAPVVGKSVPNFNQIKFESKLSQNYLNSNDVKKVIQ
jgi:hypothetical protein